SLLPIDLTDTDRAREQLAPVVRIHGNKLSRRRFRRRFCPDPHTVNIFCDLLLGDDRCILFLLCHIFFPLSCSVFCSALLPVRHFRTLTPYSAPALCGSCPCRLLSRSISPLPALR